MYSALLVRYLEDGNLRTRFRAMVGGDAGFSNHTTSKLPVRSMIIVVSDGDGDRVIGHGELVITRPSILCVTHKMSRKKRN